MQKQIKTVFVQRVEPKESPFTRARRHPRPRKAPRLRSPGATGTGGAEGRESGGQGGSGSQGQAARLPASAADACTSQPALRGSLPI